MVNVPWMGMLKRIGPSPYGQALVEFALVIPILILILMGVLDLGRGIYTYNVVANAAREGVRFGIVNPSNTSGIRAQALANTIALDPSQIAPASISCPPPAPCDSGNTLTVSVTYHFQAITPLIPSFIVTGRSTMTIE